MTRWYRLLEESELYDEENPLGELELSIQWFHDPRAKELATKKMSLLEIVQRTLGERRKERGGGREATEGSGREREGGRAGGRG